VIGQPRLTRNLNEQLVAAIGNRKTAQVYRAVARLIFAQRHQVLPVGAYISRVVIDCTFVSSYRPLQCAAGKRGGKRNAVVDSRLDFRRFLVIVPGNQLQICKFLCCAVNPVNFGKCFQPRLAALLLHDPVRSPGRKRIVKTFIRRSYRLLARSRHPRTVKTGEITHSVIGGRGHDPRITASAEDVTESAVVLKKIYGMRGQERVDCIPIDRVGKIDIEIRDHGLTLDRHIGRRREIFLF
jgi:hypothetical protein